MSDRLVRSDLICRDLAPSDFSRRDFSRRELVPDPHGLIWRRSSRSTGMNNCVETARLPDDTLAVRDSKDVLRQSLRFSPQSWSRFLTAFGASAATKSVS